MSGAMRKISRREPLKAIFGGGIARSAALADRFIWATQARIAPRGSEFPASFTAFFRIPATPAPRSTSLLA